MSAEVVLGKETRQPLKLDRRRELFIDRFLIDVLDGASLVLHEPKDAGPVLHFDLPWEGPFSTYTTVLHADDRFLAYYRGWTTTNPKTDRSNQFTCVAESKDGIQWTKPARGLIDIGGNSENNAILAYMHTEAAHNFSPFIDTNPARQGGRFKAVGGEKREGIEGFESDDGIHWRRSNSPILTRQMIPVAGTVFDSQNVVHWSPAETKYVLYFRAWEDKLRTVWRAESHNFKQWTCIQPMRFVGPDGQPAPAENLYTTQTAPYPRAPHISIAIGARFMPLRRSVTEDEAAGLSVGAPRQLNDLSDVVLFSTRGGTVYDRTHMEGLIRPGMSPSNWVSRTNYPALNLVQTKLDELSLYVNQDYGQPTAHLRRYTLRPDGLGSIRAGYFGGDSVTKPFTFEGSRLRMNYSTSAAGEIRAEIQDAEGNALPGYTLADSNLLIGNRLDGEICWKGGPDVSALAGKPIRLRLHMKDADVFAMQFV